MNDDLLKQLRNNSISGTQFARQYSAAMDSHITAIAAKHLDNTITLIATGGYGRQELCPQSDIDILFLTTKSTDHTTIENFLYEIWDSNIKIGHAARTIEECLTAAGQDSTIFTTLLDARLIDINNHNEDGQKAFQTLTTKLQKLHTTNRQQQSYIKAKLTERETRHKRFEDSRYVLEPNIKDGKGALRDYQTLFWVTQITQNAKTPIALEQAKILTRKERQRFEKAHDFLLTIRCHLHDIAARPEERLHFDIQPQLAQRLGYQHRNNAKAVERFMKHYFRVTRDIGALTRIITAAIEEGSNNKAKPLKENKKFTLINNRLGFNQDQKLKDDPLKIIELFQIAQHQNRDIHPTAFQKITRNLKYIDTQFRNNKAANAIFLNILTAEDRAALTLRRLHDAGILERFIPEFQKVTALMQFDRYHVFTVDEHTIRAIDILHQIESGSLKTQTPRASVLIHDIQNRRVLYVAMLLHDICKGREDKNHDHSSLGAELALKLCPRLGLSDAETRLVSWLIFDHLFMAETAFRRDLEDPKTLDDFIFRIHDIERLKLLTILATADIMAVGPGRWTEWKAKLITDLYILAENRLHGIQNENESTISAIPKDWDQTQPRIDIAQDPEKNATNITIYTLDRPGLFATLTGAIAASGANIIEARINTHNKIGIDSFTIQNLSAQPITKPHRHTDIRKNITTALAGALDIPAAITKQTPKPKPRNRAFDIPASITTDNRASKTATIIEIHTRDRHALLYELARIFVAHDITVKSAKINTLGLKAIDIFYVQNTEKKKILDKKTLHSLTTAIDAILREKI